VWEPSTTSRESAVGKFVDELIIERMQECAREQTLENLKLLVEAGQR